MLRRLWRWYDRHFEDTVMVPLYAAFTLIIAVEVVRRFLVREQTTWGAELSIHLFVWVSWFGCARAVRDRTHLSFPGVRAKLPRRGRLALEALDQLVWFGLAAIVSIGALRILAVQRELGSVIQGTGIPMWWTFMVIPIAWADICVRALQQLVRIARAWRRGDAAEPALGPGLATEVVAGVEERDRGEIVST